MCTPLLALCWIFDPILRMWIMLFLNVHLSVVTGNVQQASAAISVIVTIQDTQLHQCGCRTADDEIVNLACVSGYCVSNLPLST